MSDAPPEPAGGAPSASEEPAGDPAWDAPPLSGSEWLVGVLGLIYTQLPIRDTIKDVAVFATVSLLAATLWRERLPPRPARGEGARAELWLAAWTLLGAVGLIAVGLYRDARALSLGSALLVGVLYFPFALLQQWVTLRYLVQRFAGRLARGRSLQGAVLGGVLFGLCHIPFPVLLGPTLVTGVLWALAWRAGARLWAITTSHALLGMLVFVNVIEVDPFVEIWELLGR